MLKNAGSPSPAVESTEIIADAAEGTPDIRQGASADTTALGRSLLRYSPALVLVIIVVADAGRFADSDLWGHICAGEYVLRHGHFLMRDPFSYSAAGRPWLDHERLSEIVLAWAYVGGGVVGLKLLKFLCTTAVMVLISLTQAETGASMTIQMCVLTATAVGLGPTIQFRPQIFTFVLLASLFLILVRHNYGRVTRLWIIIPLMALWANLHGGYFVGLLVIALYGAVATLRDMWTGAGWRLNGFKFAGLLFASALATMLTPFGFNNWRAVIRTMGNPLTHHLVEEWKPFASVMLESVESRPISAVLYLLIVALMLALALTLALAPSGGDAPIAAVAGVFLLSALFAVRNVELFMIASAAPLSRHAELIAARYRRVDQTAEDPTHIRGWMIKQAIFTVVAAAVAIRTGLLSPRLVAAIPYPDGAVSFMEHRELNGNLLNDFNWGEYLYFHLAPRSHVFIDGRYDLVYPDSVIEQYVQFILAGPQANRLLDSHQHDFVLIKPDGPAYHLMMKRTDWKLIYRDQISVLFARAGSAAARIPDVPITGISPKSYFPGGEGVSSPPGGLADASL